MVNRKGWFRVFEATVACLLLVGVFLFVFNTNMRDNNIEDEVNDMLASALSNIDFNNSVRYAILTGDDGLIDEYFSTQINPFFNFSFGVCDLGTVCTEDNTDENVFVMSRLVSAENDIYSPRQIKLLVWNP